MNYQEYFKCSTMTYREYCKYLQDKYGIPKNSYYNEQYNTNRNENSRTSEGLVIHHICEDIKPNLSNKEVAKSCDFSHQLPENLCYCDYLEHLFLHILITEYPNEETDDVVGIGGSANYFIPELNNLFSGYIPEQSSKKYVYVINCFNRVKDDFITYKYLIGRFLSNNDVPKESLVSVVLSGDNKYFNEESKIYSELKNICDSGSCVQSHNIEIYSKVESLLNAQNKALLVLGTGLGKTSTALSYALKYGYRVLVVCPRDNIKDTWEIYSPVVSTISYVSLANEAETFDYSKYDLIVFDEAHHLNAPVWGKGIRHLLDNNVNIKILGLTATPLCDSGKKNIADIFFKDCTVVGYDAIEGIKAGVLHPVSYVSSFYTKPKEIDDALEKCKESTDELTMKLKGRLDLALNNTPTLKEIITSNMPHGNRKGIIFAQTIEDMDEAIKILKDIYPNEEYRKIHSLMNREEVQNIKEWFSDTDSGYLCTVDMISEGSHYKGVNTIFMFRKTKSGNLFEQQLGRCMTQTSLPNPHCIVFDLVNNMRNVREFTARLADAISRHGIVKTLKGERSVNPDVLSGGAKISEQYVVEDYTQDIVDAYDEINRLLGGFWTKEETQWLSCNYPKLGIKKCASHLNKSEHSVVGMAHRMNLLAPNQFSSEMDSIIQKHIDENGNMDDCVFYEPILANKTKDSVMAHSLKLGRKKYERFIRTNDNINKFKSIYDNGGIDAVMKEFNLSKCVCQSIISDFGLCTSKYTEEDIDWLIENPYATDEQLQERFPSRKVSAIKAKRRSLGISTKGKYIPFEKQQWVIDNWSISTWEEIKKELPDSCSEAGVRAWVKRHGGAMKLSYYTEEDVNNIRGLEGMSISQMQKKLPYLSKDKIRNICNKYNIKYKRLGKKSVLCVETGNIYESTVQVKNKLGINVDSCVRGKTKTAGGYHWEYVEEENE